MNLTKQLLTVRSKAKGDGNLPVLHPYYDFSFCAHFK